MPALSVSESVGDQAKAGVEALALPGATVVKLKTPSLPPGKDPTQIVICVDEEKSETLTASKKLKTYTLAVVIVRAGGAKLADDPTVRDWRQRIERKLDDQARTTFATWPAGARLNQVTTIGGKLPFDPAALPKDLDYSVVGPFAVEVIETRVTA